MNGHDSGEKSSGWVKRGRETHEEVWHVAEEVVRWKKSKWDEKK